MTTAEAKRIYCRWQHAADIRALVKAVAIAERQGMSLPPWMIPAAEGKIRMLKAHRRQRRRWT